MTPTPQQIRTLRGSLTQDQMANILDVNVRTWRRYESGDTPMKARDFEWLERKLKELS